MKIIKFGYMKYELNGGVCDFLDALEFEWEWYILHVWRGGGL